MTLAPPAPVAPPGIFGVKPTRVALDHLKDAVAFTDTIQDRLLRDFGLDDDLRDLLSEAARLRAMTIVHDGLLDVTSWLWASHDREVGACPVYDAVAAEHGFRP